MLSYGTKNLCKCAQLLFGGQVEYTASMTLQFEKIQKEIHSLTNREKAALAYRLIEDLDGPPDEGVEQLWIEEAQRRYEAYRSGNLEAIPGDEVMRRARERLK